MSTQRTLNDSLGNTSTTIPFTKLQTDATVNIHVGLQDAKGTSLSKSVKNITRRNAAVIENTEFLVSLKLKPQPKLA